MAHVERLLALRGNWSGETSLWLQPGANADVSPTTATVYGVAGERVISIDYGWVYNGASQDGRLLVAPDDTEGVHLSWCDSFHTDASIMDLVASPEAPTGAVVRATGSYRVDGSEPWGWRIELEVHGADAFELRMYNILPASMGQMEALAVRAEYARS